MNMLKVTYVCSIIIENEDHSYMVETSPYPLFLYLFCFCKYVVESVTKKIYCETDKKPVQVLYLCYTVKLNLYYISSYV